MADKVMCAMDNDAYFGSIKVNDRVWDFTNGWGTVKGLKHFFACIINDWTSYCEDYSTETLADVTYFYIC